MPEPPPRLRLGGDLAGLLEDGLRREWLVTDGKGGYACGTVATVRTRRYHGLLTAATRLPVGRVLVCGGMVEQVLVPGAPARWLHAQRWASGAVEPRGFELCEEFALEGTLPVWRIALDEGVVLERRVWMPVGSATACVEYATVAVPGGGRVGLRISPLMAWRDHHGTMRAAATPEVSATGSLLQVRWPWGAVAVLHASCGTVEMGGEWYRDEWLDAEAARGLDAVEDLFRAGAVTADLGEGDSLVLTLGVEGLGGFGAGGTATASHGGSAGTRAAEVERQAALLERGRAAAGADSDPAWIEHLLLAADSFVAARAGGQTVIAGYPWFEDWGRDTFIALPGLALETGRQELSASLLRTFAAHLDQGMIPNRFPDSGEAPQYNSVDATLWFVEALRRHVEHTGDETLVDELWAALEEVVRWHRYGTRHGIGVDPADGLLRAGEPGVALTWMDARVGDWVVTPRIGKPVEVNALWYSALTTLAGWAATRATRHDHAALARRVRAAFDRYRCEATGCLADVLDGPGGDDTAIRPNQLVAVALPHSPVDGAVAAAVLEVCQRELHTPLGPRTLAPGHPDYRGHYGGGIRERDSAYHQGTAWPWLLGQLAAAHLRVHRDPDAARALLAPVELHLRDAGLGSVSEIADGDAPHTPRGCPWQAWSVAEVLRAWRLCARPVRTAEGPGSG